MKIMLTILIFVLFDKGVGGISFIGTGLVVYKNSTLVDFLSPIMQGKKKNKVKSTFILFLFECRNNFTLLGLYNHA